jgi:hypothetical protein
VLAAAADRIRPAAVVVWAQVSRTARLGGLRLLDPTARRVIAAGPGWRLARLPPDVICADSLAIAVELIHDAVTVDATPAPRPAPELIPDQNRDGHETTHQLDVPDA